MSTIETDYLVVGAGASSFAIRAAEPDIAGWLKGSRLNLTQGLAERMGDPRMPSALARYGGSMEAALRNADRFLAGSRTPAPG